MMLVLLIYASLISKCAAETRKIFGVSGTIEIEGLDNPMRSSS